MVRTTLVMRDSLKTTMVADDEGAYPSLSRGKDVLCWAILALAALLTLAALPPFGVRALCRRTLSGQTHSQGPPLRFLRDDDRAYPTACLNRTSEKHLHMCFSYRPRTSQAFSVWGMFNQHLLHWLTRGLTTTGLVSPFPAQNTCSLVGVSKRSHEMKRPSRSLLKVGADIILYTTEDTRIEVGVVSSP